MRLDKCRVKIESNIETEGPGCQRLKVGSVKHPGSGGFVKHPGAVKHPVCACACMCA